MKNSGITLITLVAIAAVKLLGGSIKDSITKTSCSIMGQEYVSGEKQLHPHHLKRNFKVGKQNF